MAKTESGISVSDFASHSPAGEEYAAEIMARLAGMSVSEIADKVKISDRLASGLREMAYDFPDKSTGLQAISAYTGVVFKNLDFASLPPHAKRRAEDELRIISSLYGFLRPDDIIKPYRLEFTSNVSPTDTPLSAFWKGKVTIDLVHTLQQRGDHEVLDLLPADAAKCVDWKLVKRFAKVWKVDFREQNGSMVRSPHAGRLKALRGLLLRGILENHLRTVSDVSRFENASMMPLDSSSIPANIAVFDDRLNFLTAPADVN